MLVLCRFNCFSGLGPKYGDGISGVAPSYRLLLEDGSSDVVD